MNGDEYRRTSVVPQPRPAVATGFTFSVPESETQSILLVCFRLVTDNNVANRLVSLALTDGAGGLMGRFSTGFTQAASLTTDYTFAVDINVYGANGAASIGCPIPRLWLPDGASAAASIASVQAGDQVSNVRVTVDQVPVRGD